MTSREVDAYLAKVAEPHRTTLMSLREIIKEVIPQAEECISYGIPAYKWKGKYVAGFAAFKNHCSYFPFSGSVLVEVSSLIGKYSHSKSALRFATDKPLSKTLVRKLIATRVSQIKISAK